MKKRFTDCDIWEKDWVLDLPNEYLLLWYYVLSKCDHAGVFKVNLRSFCLLRGVKVSHDRALELFNMDKDRIRVLAPDRWFIEDFIVFQYGEILNRRNRVHDSICQCLERSGVNLDSIRGLKEVIESSKRDQNGVTHAPKDKVQDKDKDKDKEKEIAVQQAVDAIRKAYPRTPSKPDEERAIRKALQIIDADQLIRKVQQYAACVRREALTARSEGWKFVPHLATWLNKQRWENTPDEWTASLRAGKFVVENIEDEDPRMRPKKGLPEPAGDWAEVLRMLYPTADPRFFDDWGRIAREGHEKVQRAVIQAMEQRGRRAG
ncbi:MAG: hypothetical protein ABQ298_03640 [Puniceicoccaceae bacterium]